MIDNQRHLFDIPDGIAFLNCAARSPLMTAAIAAGEAAVARRLHDRPQCAHRLGSHVLLAGRSV